MNSKVSSILDKVRQERSRANFKKAMSRLDDATKKFSNEFSLYTEGIDLAMEAGESLKALHYVKAAQRRFTDRGFELWSFATEKTRSYNDPIVGKFLIEHAVRSGDLAAARSVADTLKEHTVDELLRRIRTKKQTLSSTVGGGHTIADDLRFNLLSDAVLCVRLNRFTEAMNGFLSVLDEDSGSRPQIEALLTGLERDDHHNGQMIYVLGCCYLVAGAFAQAKKTITRALELDPSLGDSAVARVAAVAGDDGIPRDEGQLFLAGLLIGKDDRRACDLLTGLLESSPNMAQEVIELLEPHVLTLGDNLDLHYVFVDAALRLGRADSAAAMLRKIYQPKKHRRRMCDWLDQRYRERSCPIELLKLAGETALNEAMYGKAIEIFKEALARDPRQSTAINEFLSRFRTNPLIDHFCTDRFNNAPVQARAAQRNFETYDRAEFTRAQRHNPVENDPPVAEAPAPSGFAAREFSLGADQPGAEPGFDNRDFSLGTNKPPEGNSATAKAVDPPTAMAEPAQDTDGTDNSPTARQDTTETDNAPAAIEEPVVEFTDAGAGPGTAGAPVMANADDDSDFFDYLQRDIPDEPLHIGGEDSHDHTEDGGVPGFTQDPLDYQDGSIEQSDSSRDDDTIYQESCEGVIELAERALYEGNTEKARELLGFEPANLAEEFKRKYLLAKYYLDVERPIDALVTLKTVNLSGLSRDERKDCLLRVAQCYQQLCNFEAAHSVFMRIIADHPDSDSVEMMAKANYEKYLQTMSGDAPVIEKVTSL